MTRNPNAIPKNKQHIKKGKKHMKTTKKLLTLLLSAIMVFAMLIPALAAETGSITVSGAETGETYSIYKMFDLESYNATTNAYTYKVTSDWKDFIDNGYGKDVFSLDTQDVVTLKAGVSITDNSTQAEDLAKAALAYAETKSLIPTEKATAASDSVVFSGLDLGYYLLDSSMGVLCGLTTTKPDATVNEKNTKPTVSKTVNGTATTTASIGKTVDYKITVHAKKGAQNYVLHDTLSNGLTLDTTSFEVKVGTTPLTAGTDYTVTTAGLSDGCTFELTFAKSYLDTLTGDTTIDVTYSATVNKNAVVAGDGNPNKVQLNYGENSKTTEEKATVYTYSFDLVKTKSDDHLLDGAEFELYDALTDGNKIPLVKVNDEEYRVADANEAAATGFTSAVIKAGKVNISGLGNGSYYLEETKAPDGYNKLSSRVTATISGSDNLAVMDTTDTTLYLNGGVQVINKTGAELPSTGGIGTTIFYVAGSLLAVGAIILLVTKKRMNSNI